MFVGALKPKREGVLEGCSPSWQGAVKITAWSGLRLIEEALNRATIDHGKALSFGGAVATSERGSRKIGVSNEKS